MNLKSLHRVERPREKLASGGPQKLKDDELLAILLRTGYSGKNVLELSREILKKYPNGSLSQANLEGLNQVKGLRGSRAATLVAAFELAKRFEGCEARPVLDSPAKVLDQLASLRDKKKEHLVALYLTARNQLIEREVISVGTLNASLVHPREVFAPALEHRSGALIVAHNHPSGDPVPSREDREVTLRLAQAGRLLGIELLDHLIITEREHFSFKEKGLLRDG